MQQRGGVTPGGDRILSTKLIALSHTPQDNAGTYGLGWQRTSTADPARVGHGGSLLTVSARQDLVPSSGVGVAVLLDSYTPTYSHPFEISTGLIEISEGRSPEVGVPVATLIDLGLGAATIAVAAWGLVGMRRASPWARRRAHFPAWRRVVRLAPHAIAPAAAVLILFGLTSGPGNPATPITALTLWPAAIVLLMAGGLVGVTLIVVRLRAFRRQQAARSLAH